MKNKTAKGHLAALFTILIWGTTFISTTVLLQDFLPAEILFVRFVIGFLALWMVCPRRLKGLRPEQELLFAGAGLCGVCLYYLLENIALTLTMASNVALLSPWRLFSRQSSPDCFWKKKSGWGRPSLLDLWRLWEESGSSVSAIPVWNLILPETCWRFWPPEFGRFIPFFPGKSANMVILPY